MHNVLPSRDDDHVYDDDNANANANDDDDDDDDDDNSDDDDDDDELLHLLSDNSTKQRSIGAMHNLAIRSQSSTFKKKVSRKNIARGTTDPGY